MGTEQSMRPVIERSSLFFLYYQVECLAGALRLVVQSQAPLGPGIRVYVHSMVEVVLSISSGIPFELLKKVGVPDCPADMLCVAELIRGSLLASMTPEERTETAKFGFNQT